MVFWARFVHLFWYGRHRSPPLTPPVMSVALTIIAPDELKAERKARKKAEKKRVNTLLAELDNSMTLLTQAVWEAQMRVEEARRALKGFGAEAPTQGVSDYLTQMGELLGQAAICEAKTASVDVICEHFFPGRNARMQAECDQRNQDRRYEQQERAFGA